MDWLVLVVLVVGSGVFPNNAEAVVVINEFLANGSPEWIEFYNSEADWEYMKEYYVDDDLDFGSDAGSSAKIKLDGLTGSVTWPVVEMGPFLNNSGDWAVLFDEVGTVLDQYEYLSNPGSGVTIGRDPDGTGSFKLLDTATKGEANTVLPTPIPTETLPSPTPTETPDPTPPLPTPTPAEDKETFGDHWKKWMEREMEIKLAKFFEKMSVRFAKFPKLPR